LAPTADELESFDKLRTLLFEMPTGIRDDKIKLIVLSP
jgi:hypothetical protein